MMQDLREKTKIVMIVVALAFVGLMVFEWGMDISGQSVAGQTGELGRVDGEPISAQAYSVTYQELYQALTEQRGGSLSPEEIRQLENQAFDEVVNQLLLQQELKRRGITVSNAEIQQAAQWRPHPDLMNNELFLTNGRFDITKYQQFLAGPAANEDLLLQLEQYYRSSIPREKLIRQVTAGTYLTDASLWRMWQDRSETAVVDYVALDLSQLVPGDIEVTPAEVEAYYEENEDEFKRSVSVRMNIAYLLKTPTAADSAAALERSRAVRAEIAAGADFAEVARRESSDPGSAQAGGELGPIRRGQMVPPFEEAVFTLPIGAVSEPVATQFGYHVIQVQTRTGEEAVARHILIPVGSSEQALDALYTKADSLEQLAARVGIQRAARATGAVVRPAVTVSEDEPFVPGLGSALEAVEWAQDEELLGDEAEEIGPLFETAQAFFVVQVEQVIPEGQLSVEEASAHIRRQLIVERKRARAREIGREMVAEIRGGKTLEEVSQARKLTVETAGPFTRGGYNPSFGTANEVTGAAFGTPIGQVSDVVESTSGLFLVRPRDRVAANRADYDAAKEQLRASAARQLQEQEFSRWLASLRDQAEIVDRRAEARRAAALAPPPLPL